MQVKLKLSLRKLLRKYFQILNLIQEDTAYHFTEVEIQVITEFLLLPPKFSYARFSLPAKRRVIQSIKEIYDKDMTMLSINNKLYSLVSKGYIKRDTDKVMYLQPYIIKATTPLISSPSYDITLTLQNDTISEGVGTGKD